MNKEELIYDLIFSNEDKYSINIADYIEPLYRYKYDRFIKEIKIILSMSKVQIEKEVLNINSVNQIIWVIKTKKVSQDVEI